MFVRHSDEEGGPCVVVGDLQTSNWWADFTTSACFDVGIPERKWQEQWEHGVVYDIFMAAIPLYVYLGPVQNLQTTLSKLGACRSDGCMKTREGTRFIDHRLEEGSRRSAFW